ncbi:MAG: hypothetical protein ACYC8T_25355 [Myxococcaceae bacterium]
MSRLVPALAVLLSAAPALALPPISASVGFATDVASFRSYDLVDTDDHLPKLAVTGGTRFALERGTVDLDLLFTTGATGTTAHQVLQTGLGLVTLEAAVGYRYGWMRHFEPYARLSAGPGWATLRVSTPGGAVHQTVTNVTGTGLLGLSFPFQLGPKAAIALVFDLGVGYSLRPVFNFDSLQHEVPVHPTGEEVREVPLSMGRMDLSGFAYRFGVGVRL